MTFFRGAVRIIADALVVALGLILIYIFHTIEVLGMYGQESNAAILFIEKYLSIPIIIIGLTTVVTDLRRMSNGKVQR